MTQEANFWEISRGRPGKSRASRMLLREISRSFSPQFIDTCILNL